MKYTEPALEVRQTNKWIKRLFIISVLFFCFSIIYSYVFAYTFPSDALSAFYELPGAGSHTLVSSSTKTILGISIQQSGTASISQVLCDSTVMALNYGKDFPFNATSYHCNGNLTVSKTGNDSASFIITYVPRNTSLPFTDPAIPVSPVVSQKTQAETLATLIFVMAMASLSYVFIYTIKLYFKRPK